MRLYKSHAAITAIFPLLLLSFFVYACQVVDSEKAPLGIEPFASLLLITLSFLVDIGL